MWAFALQAIRLRLSPQFNLQPTSTSTSTPPHSRVRTLRLYSIFTSTGRPMMRLRRNSLASEACGSAGRSRAPGRGARMLRRAGEEGGGGRARKGAGGYIHD